MNTTVTRTISGVLFLAIMVSGLILHPYLYGALMLVLLVGLLWEFYHMNLGQRHKVSRIIAIITGAALFVSVFCVHAFGVPHKFIGLSAFFLLTLMISTLLEKDLSYFRDSAILYTGLLYLAIPLALSNLVVFRGGPFDGRLMLAFFCIIWASDVGAYCFGMLFGQKGGKKLFPSISPKKSWAGFWGGLLLAVVASAVLSWTGLFDFSIWHCLVLSVVMHVAGVYGDLFESMWKRSCGVKDSSQLIPGHGGLMDRFDSALFAIPAGFIYLVLFGLV